MDDSLEGYAAINRAQTISESDGFTDHRYRQFERRIPSRAASVLDIGCNTGRGGRVLAGLRPGLRIHGLDVVPERVRELDPLVYCEGRVGVASALPWPDESFDALVAGEFIEHVSPSEVDKVLSEFFRVVKLGGYVLLTTPNPGDVKRRARGRTVLGGAHLSQHHPRVLSHRLKAAGFGRVRVYGSGRTSLFVGQARLFTFVCGSYMAVARKY